MTDENAKSAVPKHGAIGKRFRQKRFVPAAASVIEILAREADYVKGSVFAPGQKRIAVWRVKTLPNGITRKLRDDNLGKDYVPVGAGESK